MRISVGADDTGALPDYVIERLRGAGHAVTVYGDPAGHHLDYVDAARTVAEDVAAGRADGGIVLCWTGTGVSIAANKVAGVRAALCGDAETARGARRWNHANVLALSMRTTATAVAGEILDAWFAEPYGREADDLASVERLAALDAARSSLGA